MTKAHKTRKTRAHHSARQPRHNGRFVRALPAPAPAHDLARGRALALLAAIWLALGALTGAALTLASLPPATACDITITPTDVLVTSAPGTCNITRAKE